MTTLYTFDLVTGEHTGEREAQTRPNGDPIVDVIGATPTAPPVSVSAGQAAIWKGKSWALVPDHRQKRDSGGVVVEGTGTPYWLPGDDWQTPAQYMDAPGALPERALLIQPERPATELLAEARAAKRREIASGYEAAMTATLTMPTASPSSTTSAADIATEAALFAVSDPDGLADVRSILSARRAELETAVDAASTVAEIEAVAVTYPV